MAPNYTKLAATADKLIAGAGRPITLVSLDYDAPDAAQPWLSVEDPRETPGRSAVVNAAFVPLSTASKLGISRITDDMVKRGDRTCLVGSRLDPTPFEEVIDSKDQRRLRIEHAEVLQPGPLLVLSFLVLRE